MLPEFGIAGYVTVAVLGLCGVSGMVFAKLSQPIDAPYVLARRLKRAKLLISIYLFVLAVALLVAVLALVWGLWAIVLLADLRSTNLNLQLSFSSAFEVTTCIMVIVMTVLPCMTFGINLRDLAGRKPPDQSHDGG